MSDSIPDQPPVSPDLVPAPGMPGGTPVPIPGPETAPLPPAPSVDPPFPTPVPPPEVAPTALTPARIALLAQRLAGLITVQQLTDQWHPQLPPAPEIPGVPSPGIPVPPPPMIP